MSTDCQAADLPIEIIVHIFEYLSVADLKEAALVCKVWYAASLDPLLQRNVVLAVNASVNNSRPLTGLRNRKGFHLALTNLDGSENAQAALSSCKSYLTDRLISLSLKGSSISEQSFLSVIELCKNLSSLDVSSCNSILLSGSLLRQHLSNVELPLLSDLNLSSLRHLTDMTLTIFLSMACNLKRLQLASVPLIFRSSYIYTTDKDRPSSAALTFQCLMKHIKDKLSDTLVSLNFSRTGINDNALRELADVPSLTLKQLILISTKEITNQGVAALCKKQTSITDFDLSHNSQLTDGSAKQISLNLTHLERLHLRKVHLTESGVKSLKDLQFLTDLNIGGCFSQDFKDGSADLMFKQLSGLICLDLSYSCGLSDKTFASLCQYLTSLTHLDLTSCFNLTDITVREISKSLSHLQVLSLAWCKRITDYGLMGVIHDSTHDCSDDQCKCTRQTNTTYFNYQPPVKDIAPAIKRPSLKELSAIVSNENDVPYPISLLTNLTVLDLSACPKLGDSSLTTVIRYPALAKLSLNLCHGITDNSLIAIASSNILLESLSFDRCTNVTDRGVFAVLFHCRRLSHLSFSGCPKITDVSIDEIIKRKCKLKTLNIAMCNISSTAIERLERLIPTLTTIQKKYAGAT